MAVLIIRKHQRKSRDHGKGGIMSEDNGGFLPLPKNIPKNYLKLLHPLNSIDKMSIFKTFTFTCVVYLQVQKVGFMSSTNNFID